MGPQTLKLLGVTQKAAIWALGCPGIEQSGRREDAEETWRRCGQGGGRKAQAQRRWQIGDLGLLLPGLRRGPRPGGPGDS